MEEKRFTLRMDAELFQEISALAKKNRRSTAKEIEYAIAKYISEIKSSDLLHSADINKLSSDESKNMLKQLNNINKKYDRFK